MLKQAAALLAVAASVTLCSCQSLSTSSRRAASAEPAQLAPAQVAAVPAGQPRPAPGQPIVTAGYYPPALPSHASVAMMPTHHHGAAPCPCCAPKTRFAFSDSCEQCAGGGACDNGQCAYRPYDEYICDGGDNAPGVEVRRDWSVHGLDQEDTIVHFDTLKGDTEWTASNKVCLYAPRFGAVRQVTGMVVNDQADRLADARKGIPLVTDQELKIVSDMNQPRQPITGLAVKQAQAVHDQNKGLTAETTNGPKQVFLDLLPYEQLDLIRRGVLSNNDKPRLTQSAANAIVWTEKQAVQVVLDGKLPLESTLNAEIGETVMYDLAGKPKMRIIKIADKSEAQPGDIVSFTLRFDNVGDQKVGNVTIIDNLTTRLEYIEASQECSHEAVFQADLNEGETAILRWEVKDPLRVLEGGIIRFKCRVR
jgi:uncharacterized repeat protein (TIGR01451 family)